MKRTFPLLLLLLAFSCSTPGDFVYLQNAAEEGQHERMDLKNPEFRGLKVKVDDILAIQINSVDSRASQPYNITGSLNQTNQPITNFLVDADGNIDYPGIGKLEVTGLTVREIKEKLGDKIKSYLVDAVINVRILNFKITVLGEVKLPSVYPQVDEQVSVLDAIGMAGDLTDYADRENILLIRQQDGKQQIIPFSLITKDILESPDFYLQQNDVIYAPPRKEKTKYARSEPVGRIVLPALGVVTALVSLVIVATNNR
ncbi:MAG: polysaccharide export protein [Roseivirga sp.]|nr:polysaccharide export protein [Roseivirga sp.]